MLRIVSVAVFCVALAMGSVDAKAITYDARADFSGASNPNGQWSYGWANTLGGSMTNYPDYTMDALGFYGWHDFRINPDTPHVTAPYGTVLGHTYQPNELAFHPAWQNWECSIIRWTAPSDGTSNVIANFAGAHTGASEVYVYHNAENLFAIPLLGYSVAPTFNETFEVHARDTIDFAVSKWAGSWNTTAVSVSIDFSPVPEPSTFALFGMGAIGLLGYGWRKNRVKRELKAPGVMLVLTGKKK